MKPFWNTQDATGANKEGTPSLTPSPERNKKGKKDDSESDTEEYKAIKKRKEIQNLQVVRLIFYLLGLLCDW